MRPLFVLLLGIAIGIIATSAAGWIMDGPEQSVRSRALTDMEAIANTITQFQNKNGRFPAAEELKELPLVPLRPLQANGEVVPSGTIIKRVIDPYGRSYFYSRLSDADGFLLKSFGRDGRDSEDDYLFDEVFGAGYSELPASSLTFAQLQAKFSQYRMAVGIIVWVSLVVAAFFLARASATKIVPASRWTPRAWLKAIILAFPWTLLLTPSFALGWIPVPAPAGLLLVGWLWHFLSRGDPKYAGDPNATGALACMALVLGWSVASFCAMLALRTKTNA